MRWFKHYSDAHTSESLSTLILDLGFEGYGRYWMLMEFLAFKFDGETTEFKFHPAIVRETLRIRSWNKLETFLERIGNVRGMETEWTKNEIKFNAPILLELKNRDFKTTRTDREGNARKRKKKKEIKKENNILGFENTNTGMCKHLFDDVVQSWNDTCPGNGKLKHHKGIKPETIRKFFEIVSLNDGLKNIESWKSCFEIIKDNDFLNGSNSNSSFVCTLDWLVTSHKVIDVWNGLYGSEKGGSEITDENIDEEYKKYLEKKNKERELRGVSNA